MAPPAWAWGVAGMFDSPREEEMEEVTKEDARVFHVVANAEKAMAKLHSKIGSLKKRGDAYRSLIDLLEEEVCDLKRHIEARDLLADLLEEKILALRVRVKTMETS